MAGEYYNYTDTDKQMKLRTKRLVIFGVVVILLVLALFIWQAFRPSDTFRVVGTDPATNNVQSIAPYFKVTFNQDLTQDGLSVTSDPGIIDSYSVSGKTLTVNLTAPGTPLDTSRTYKITVLDIADTHGTHIKNQVFTFAPKDPDPGALSVSQQQALQKQDQAAGDSSTIDDVDFDSVPALFSNPTSVGPVNAVEHAIVQFSPYAQSVTVAAGTIQTKGNTTNFTVIIDNNPYKARLVTQDKTMRLYLSTMEDKQVFDSGDIDLSSYAVE